MVTQEFGIATSSHDAMLDITSQVIEAIRASGITEGFVTVFCPHTTAAITINENADADVIHDVLMQLDKMVPWAQPFFDHGRHVPHRTGEERIFPGRNARGGPHGYRKLDRRAASQ